MPRSPEDNQEIRDSRREELIAAATRVFANKGFARTKIADIASEAGVSHGLVYHYFRSKEDVFAAIVDAMIQGIEEELEAPTGSAYEQLVQGIRRRRDIVVEHAPFEANRLVIQAMMQGSVPDAVRERVQDHVASIYGRTVERVRRAQQDGDVDDSLPAEELASALVMLMRGLSIRTWRLPQAPIAIPSADTMIRLLLPRPTRGDVR